MIQNDIKFTTADLRLLATERCLPVGAFAMLLWAADLLDAHRKENDQLRGRAINDHQFIVGLEAMLSTCEAIRDALEADLTISERQTAMYAAKLSASEAKLKEAVALLRRADEAMNEAEHMDDVIKWIADRAAFLKTIPDADKGAI